MRKINWQGVYPAMLTPFTADDRLDLAMFTKNVDAQIAAGIEGMILGGSIGEGSTLDADEKIELLLHAKELAKDRIPVLLTIAEQATKVAVALAQDAEKNGADGLMILPPMRYKAD